MKKLIILGSGAGYSKVNVTIEYGNYEIWGMASNLLCDNMPKMDLVFEMHTYNKELNYIYKKMKQFKYKYITCDRIKGIKSKLYPINKIKEKYGKYFCSSFVYMLIYAMHLGYKDILFIGIDYGCLGTIRENLIERPNLEYWIGRAEGEGINIDVSLCPYLLTSWKMYGYERINEDKKYLEIIRNQIQNNILDKINNNRIIEDIREYIKMLLISERM